MSMKTAASRLGSQSNFHFVSLLVALLLSVRPTAAAWFSSSSPASGLPLTIRLDPYAGSNDSVVTMQTNDDDGFVAVPKKAARRKNKPQAQHDDQNGILPYVAHIPPTDENSEFKPFMLLLCGIPGSGKSTFAKSLEQAMPYKWVRINQDDLGNRRRCEQLARTALANGQCPVIDRCNFDKEQRGKFISIATEYTVPVDCVVLESETLVTVKECIRRCQQRRNHPTIAANEARSVVIGVARQMKAPLADKNQESIRDVRYITDRNAFNDAIVEYCNRKA